MSQRLITLDCSNLSPFVSQKDFDSISNEVKKAHKLLVDRDGAGGEFLGWIDLPDKTSDRLLGEIEDCAEELRRISRIFVIIGIGGSYLGARAAIEFCNPKKKIRILYAGCNLNSDYLANILDEIRDADVSVNVISKSGGTLETAVTFRVIYEYLGRRYSRNEVRKRIVCTTDRRRGVLKKIADSQGFRTFVIPDDVVGRFSVLSAVGLLPLSVAGVDIRELLRGASDMKAMTANPDLEENISYRYAAARRILYKKGKKIEILSAFNSSLEYVAEWWRQLFAESEGKQNRGLFPATCIFSTDLHSIGQLIQEGERNIFETFLITEKSHRSIKVPALDKNIDGLDYIKGKDLDYINKQAYLGTKKAHMDGGVPNMTIKIPDRGAYALGSLFFFFQKAVSISAYIQGVNPFNQPGVEAYKKNMFAMLGRDKA